MKGVWAIVPVKPLHEGKSRLASVLNPHQRLELNRWFLTNTLRILMEVATFEQILVVSHDNKVLSLAQEYGAQTIQENVPLELNTSIEQATRFAQQSKAEAILILPTDLPLLNVSILRQLLSLVQNPPSVVIAPDRYQRGTNALLVSPPGLLEYHYGEGSFAIHLRAAHQIIDNVKVLYDPQIALDIDTVEDYAFYQALNEQIPGLDIWKIGKITPI